MVPRARTAQCWPLRPWRSQRKMYVVIYRGALRRRIRRLVRSRLFNNVRTATRKSAALKRMRDDDENRFGGLWFPPRWGQISPPIDTGSEMSDLLNHSGATPPRVGRSNDEP
jgi:hypothetical protein